MITDLKVGDRLFCLFGSRPLIRECEVIKNLSSESVKVEYYMANGKPWWVIADVKDCFPTLEDLLQNLKDTAIYYDIKSQEQA